MAYTLTLQNVLTAIDHNNTKLVSATSFTEAMKAKVDVAAGKNLSTNDYTSDAMTKVSAIKNNGVSNEFFAADGSYYKIENVGIDDTTPSAIKTYSSNKIDSEIDAAIANLVLPTQNDAPTTWQKTFENVKTGDVLEVTTDLNYSISKALVQVTKEVAGATGVTKTITQFNGTTADTYFYNHDNVEFSNTGTGFVKIKDNYSEVLVLEETSGLYQSSVISKANFKDLKSITIEEV